MVLLLMELRALLVEWTYLLIYRNHLPPTWSVVCTAVRVIVSPYISKTLDVRQKFEFNS